MEDEEEYGFDPQFAAQQMAVLPGQYRAAQQREEETRRRIAAEREAQFKQAQEMIRQSRMGGASRSQELLALSQAFLSPKPYRGLAGTLANVVPAIGQIAGSREDAEQKRAEMLAQMQQRYAAEQMQGDLDAATNTRQQLLEMMKYYGPLAKPQRPRTALSPVTERVIDLDTGEEVVPLSSVPAAAIQQLRDYVTNPAHTPENKRAAAANFEQRFRVPASRVLPGGM